MLIKFIVLEDRIWYENAKYHVMARSIYGRPLFKTEDDYELFALQVKENLGNAIKLDVR